MYASESNNFGVSKHTHTHKHTNIAKQLKRFLGVINFYRRFMAHAAHKQNVLQKLIKGNKKNDTTKLVWNDEADAAFTKFKEDLANVAILAHPSPHAKLALNVDASNHAIGGVLQQIGKEGPEPLAFFSK